MKSLSVLAIAALAALSCSLEVSAVKEHDFRKVAQTSFGRRLRPLSERAEAAGPSQWKSPYSLPTPGIASAEYLWSGEQAFPDPDQGGASWTFPVRSSLYPNIKFVLRLDFLPIRVLTTTTTTTTSAPSGFDSRSDGGSRGEDLITRLRIDEVDSTTSWQRYNETARWALWAPEDDGSMKEPPLARTDLVKLDHNKQTGSTVFSFPVDQQLVVQHDPLRIALVRKGKEVAVWNERGLFHMEHFRVKSTPQTETETVAESSPSSASDAKAEGDNVEIHIVKSPDEKQAPLQAPAPEGQVNAKIDTTWFEGEPDAEAFEERWKQWSDSKPKGPEGLSFDVSFPGVQHIYGLAEHASPLSLPSTDGSSRYTEPYRLWNVDIFEYLADSPMSLYGAIPLIQAHSADHSVGIVSLTGSETWIDVKHPSSGVQTHFISESGILDLFFLPGSNPDALFEQYASLTGSTPLPPLWSLAYHQCRWNYMDDADVLQVNRRFDEEDIPLDVTWLDIEYAQDHKYFDWEKKQFPDPAILQNTIGEMGRKMVAIVDPHIKRSEDFRIYKDAQDLDVITKKPDGTTNYEGWCWPGSSVWVDFFNPKSWSWWKDMFSFKIWKDSTKYLFIWNDMNEPAVFDGPEISMPRDNIHQGGWEHRDVHNINGMLFQRATFMALQAREQPAKRPFVLSRSFFAGSQRYGAIWTGDNLGTWDHMAGETSMLLSLNICGMTFCGADVGGFFGNPSVEMLVRWYQAGAFMPFFRAHAHIDTKRREPFLYEEPYKSMMRDIIRLRYQMLPVWYTAFHESAVSGQPVIRPQYVAHPSDETGFAVDDQYYIGGSGLLFKPVTQEHATSTDVHLASGQPYYDYFTHEMHPASKKARAVSFATPLERFPLFLQGGSILPIRSRARRSSTLMWKDPFTLIIALGIDGEAEGKLYLDDGDSYAYQSGEYILRHFRVVCERQGWSICNEEATNTQSLTTTDSDWVQGASTIRVEKIVILGAPKKPQSVSVGGIDIPFEYTPGSSSTAKSPGQAGRLVLKPSALKITQSWQVQID